VPPLSHRSAKTEVRENKVHGHGLFAKVNIAVAYACFISAAQADNQRNRWPQDYERVVANWQEIIPDKDAPLGISIKEKPPFSDLHWHVYVENGQVVAEATLDAIENHPPLPPFDPIMSDRDPLYSEEWVAAPVDDGWIIAFNFGEWGAAIYWFNKDGSRQYEVLRGVVNQFLSTPEGLFAAADVRPTFQGPLTLIKFERSAETRRWNAKSLTDLSFAGPFARLSDGGLLFIGDRALYSYSANGFRKITDNSISLGDSKLYSGGRVAVTKDNLYSESTWFIGELNLHTFTQRFLVPDSRFVNDFVRWDVSHEAKDTRK